MIVLHSTIKYIASISLVCIMSLSLLTNTPTPVPEAVKEATVVVHTKYRGYGTGWAVAPDTIVTNFHVVADKSFDHPMEEIMVETRDGKLHTATVIKYKEDVDLAILKISDKIFKNPLQIAQKAPVRGDKLVAVGYPKYSVEKVMRGVAGTFSLMYTDRPSLNSPDWNLTARNTTLDAGPGASGSAVLNEDQEVVGILFAGIPDLVTKIIPVHYLNELLGEGEDLDGTGQ